MVGRLAVDDYRLGSRPCVLLCHEGPGLDEHVKGRAPSCAVVLLTGRSDEYDELCGIGFDEVLLKPKRTADLISSILATTARCRSDWNQKTAAA